MEKVYNIKSFISSYFKNDYYKSLTFILILAAIIIRIYNYIFCPDLWLDPAKLAVSVYGIDWSNLFFHKLPHNQGAPLGIILVTKFFGYFLGYGEHTFYLLPFISGIGIFILAYVFAKKISANSLFHFIFIFLFAWSLLLIFYTTQFKQYMIEAFITLYILYEFFHYLQSEDFKSHVVTNRFFIVCIISFLFSTPSIFVIGSAFLTIFYFFRKEFVASLKKNDFKFICFALFVAAYLLTFLVFQFLKRGEDYWKYLPVNFIDFYRLISEQLHYSLFSVYYRPTALFSSLLIFGVFIYSLKKMRDDIFPLFIFSSIFYLTFILQSMLGLYPVGGNGLHGNRPDVFMYSILYITFAYGLYRMLDLIDHKIIVKLVMFIFLIVNILHYGLYYNDNIVCLEKGRYAPSVLINTINSEKKGGDVVCLGGRSYPTYKYYQFLNKKSDQHIQLKFPENGNVYLDDVMKEHAGHKLFLLYSHRLREYSDPAKDFLDRKKIPYLLKESPGARLFILDPQADG